MGKSSSGGKRSFSDSRTVGTRKSDHNSFFGGVGEAAYYYNFCMLYYCATHCVREEKMGRDGVWSVVKMGLWSCYCILY